MAKLFVANLTRQHHEFLYLEPESGRLRQQLIPVGQQVQVGGDAAPEMLSAIVAQHEVYGIVSVRSLGTRTEFTGLCFQMDKPIKVDVIVAGLEANQRRLEAQGVELRKQAAVASGVAVRESLFQEGRRPVQGFSVELEEQAPGALKGSERTAFDRTKLHETISVDLKN